MATEQELREAAERVQARAMTGAEQSHRDCALLAAHALRAATATLIDPPSGTVVYGRIAPGTDFSTAHHEPERAIAQQEAVAWMTHHEEPMLFPTRDEAALYCDDDEEPIPLYTAPPAAPGVLIGWREIPGGCEIMTREDAYNLYGDDIEPVYAAASPSAPE